MRSERDRADVEEFVAVCSGRLLGTADLLIGDPDRAEQLLVRALAAAWSSWRRLDAPPETYVRQVLVARATTRWRPVGPGRPAAGDDRLRRALAGLTRRQRAVVVLLWYDGLDEEDTAAALGCSAATVATVASAALVRLGVSPGPQVDVLRRDLAALVDRSPGPRTRRLIEAMDDRAV
ncbi:MAG: sigma factor-like helix-turn-helix DNA-binding protein, partial [Nocardioidaceae bacterium]